MSLPPSEIPLGAMRFNSDSRKLEYWMGSAWMQIQTFSPNLDGGARGIIAGGGNYPAETNRIQFITIPTQGNSTDFGDAATAVTNVAATSNSLRGVFGGGYVPGSNTDDINYLEIQSMGNSVTFGNLTVARREFGASSEAHGGLD